VKGEGIMMAHTLAAKQPASVKAILLFVAGFVCVLTFHRLAGLLLAVAGILPGPYDPWPMQPVPPFGVPRIASLAFWGGLWAVLIGFTFVGRAHGPGYWLGWILACGILPPLGSLYLVPWIKGLPITGLSELPFRFAVSSFFNGGWGLSIALLLALTGARKVLWRH
jgi:hypothetical protein